jgi:SAM-dependent methyltransferase
MAVMRRGRANAADAASAAARQVIWHDLECGAYRADLALWRELAERENGPVLEVGAGTGRVSLDLARAGHTVTALEREPALLDALRARDRGRRVRPVCADARRLKLDGERFALCLVPMQTVQLFSAADRRGFLTLARSALAPGGLLAFAILGRVEPFSCAAGDIGPTADTAVIDGVLYSSRPTRVKLGRHRVTIERERCIRRVRTHAFGAVPHSQTAPTFEHDAVALERLGARELQREAAAAGLRAAETVALPPTEDHAGSRVVLLRA